jgi:hypothetical protein
MEGPVMDQDTAAGAATGGVRLVLRLEGLATLALATAAFFATGGNPWLYLVLFFLPDLSFAAYALNPRSGAAIYNTAHSYLLPAIVGALGWLLGQDLVWQIALILAAHIGFDRAFGYGLKYAGGFNQTHLGRIGRPRGPASTPDES